MEYERKDRRRERDAGEKSRNVRTPGNDGRNSRRQEQTRRGIGARDQRAGQEAQRRSSRDVRVQRKNTEADARTSREESRPRNAERNSRAAQEAQRRRDERKERARLNGLREKQKRKAKHRTHRRISSDVWKRLLIMVGIIAALVLSMVIFFRVRHLEVTGSSYYSADEILEAAGVAQGDNLLTVQRGQIAGNVMASLPYVRSVQVARHLPDTLVINITEFNATYSVQDTAGDWYLITAGGKATEKNSEQQAKGHIVVEGLKIETPVIGEEVQAAAEPGKELNAQGQLEAAKTLLQELESAELIKEITSVSVPSSFNLTVQYGDRFTVELGNTEQLDYKLEFLKVVVSEQKDYATGRIDLTLKSGNEARITLNE